MFSGPSCLSHLTSKHLPGLTKFRGTLSDQATPFPRLSQALRPPLAPPPFASYSPPLSGSQPADWGGIWGAAGRQQLQVGERASSHDFIYADLLPVTSALLQEFDSGLPYRAHSVPPRRRGKSCINCSNAGRLLHNQSPVPAPDSPRNSGQQPTPAGEESSSGPKAAHRRQQKPSAHQSPGAGLCQAVSSGCTEAEGSEQCQCRRQCRERNSRDAGAQGALQGARETGREGRV